MSNDITLDVLEAIAEVAAKHGIVSAATTKRIHDTEKTPTRHGTGLYYDEKFVYTSKTCYRLIDCYIGLEELERLRAALDTRGETIAYSPWEVVEVAASQMEKLRKDAAKTDSGLQARVDAVIAKHVPEWHTDYNVPVFDEFDSSTVSYYRCKACKQRLYEGKDEKCNTVKELTGDA